MRALVLLLVAASARLVLAQGMPDLTPYTPTLQQNVHEELKAIGANDCTLQPSDHCVDGPGLRKLLRFSVLVFTNLSHDHLDFHGDLESYFEAKRRLFFAEPRPVAVVNVGDEHGRRLAGELPEAITFSATPASFTNGISLSEP